MFNWLPSRSQLFYCRKTGIKPFKTFENLKKLWTYKRYQKNFGLQSVSGLHDSSKITDKSIALLNAADAWVATPLKRRFRWNDDVYVLSTGHSVALANLTQWRDMLALPEPIESRALNNII